jgi:[protein-PII] uridylyltransferase
MSTFQDSMPERYRGSFDGAAIQEHGAIVARRTGPVHLEIWQRLPGGGAVLCVVAEDRPGLLSFVSASLVVHGADITAAKAYTRTRPETGRPEAIDFVWVKRAVDPAAPFAQADLEKIRDTLTALVTGMTSVESVLRRDRLPVRGPSNAPTRVTFDDASGAGPCVLTVETVDRPGLLLAITQALYRAGVQIVDSEATTRSGFVVDHFTLVELDGGPVAQLRRMTVEAEVLSAIEARARVTSTRRSSKPPKPGRPAR